MATVYEFGVLGPIQVRVQGRPLPVGSARERLVLAAMLLNAGRLTPADRLIHALWTEPPRSARAQLHNMISRWRRTLGVQGGELIATRPLGYELRLGEHRLDLVEFRRLVERARQATARDDHETAAGELAAALVLWRGPALADVAGETMTGPRQALDEERLAAAEALLEAQLALGRLDRVLSGLPGLLAEQPYRERLYEIEMLALDTAGRRADALAAYRRVHSRLVDELGLEPGPALVDLHQRILEGRGQRPPRPVPARPRQLPPAAGAVTGRDDLIAEIRAELSRADRPGPPVVVLVGAGGVGKSTVALHVAHGLARMDDQLYADLGGSRPVPADPHEVAGRFLRALGVDSTAVPRDGDERIALYRSRLAGRRVLVLLDDAAGEEQVRPLLPGAADCAALVTSRRRLAALVGARRWQVPVLSPPDSRELLGRLVGAERAAGEPEAAAAIADLAGHLPLAVTVAGARLAARPDWTLADFATRLAGERGRLDELVVGDLDVRASIGLSYRALDEPLRLVFRRLGLITAPDWPSWVVQPLADHPALLLDRLVDVHLVEPRGRDVAGQPRFRLHDLVADFARERAHAEDGTAQRTRAVTGLLSGWLALATRADRQLRHDHTCAADLVGAPASAPPTVAWGDALVRVVETAPQDWFEAERAALVAAVGQARDLARDDPAGADLAGWLALRLTEFCSMRGYQDDRERTLQDAVACARGRVDDRLFAQLLDSLFAVRAHRARDAELPALAGELATVARRLGDRRLEVRAFDRAGVVARRAGRLAEAAARFDEAIAACTGEITDQLYAAMLQGRAQVHRLAAEHRRAVALSGRALAILRRHYGRSGRLAAHLLVHGDVLLDAALEQDGLVGAAEHAYAEALEITRECGYPAGTAILEGCLGRIDTRRRRWRAAEVRLARTLRYHEAHGDLDDVADVLDALGELALARGTPAAAIAALRRSLELWRRIGAPLEQARTLALLGQACCAAGDEAAGEYHRGSATILGDLGLGEASLRLPALVRRQ